MRVDREPKLLTLNCGYCNSSGRHNGSSCSNCRGRGRVKVANPFYVPPGEMPTWFQLGGGEGWIREMERLAAIAGLKPNAARIRPRLDHTARLLEPWRLRSSVHCNLVAAERILAMLEACRREPTRRLVGEYRAPWTDAELGAMIVELRNRFTLFELGRLAPKPKGPRFDPDRIPLERLDWLIQRHPNMDLVERLRQARNRRMTTC